METHSSILAWRISWTEERQATIHRVAKSQTHLKRFRTHANIPFIPDNFLIFLISLLYLVLMLVLSSQIAHFAFGMAYSFFLEAWA